MNPGSLHRLTKDLIFPQVKKNETPLNPGDPPWLMLSGGSRTLTKDTTLCYLETFVQPIPRWMAPKPWTQEEKDGLTFIVFLTEGRTWYCNRHEWIVYTKELTK